MDAKYLCIHLQVFRLVTTINFTKMSITPSVSFVVDIPGNIDESWYDGLVHVLFKDSPFE